MLKEVYKNRKTTLMSGVLILFIFLLYFLMSILAKYDYYLYHSIIELASVVCFICVTIITVTIWKYAKGQFFIALIGISSIFIVMIDVVHILAYEGGTHFISYGPNLSTQFWVIGRFVQSSTILAAIFLQKIVAKPKWHFTISNYFLIIIVFLYFTLFTRWFPTMYVDGEGLTLFKIVSEYVIIGILILSLILVFRLESMKNKRLQFLVLYIFFFIISEFMFTLYIGTSDFTNFMGHIFRFISSVSFLIYFLDISISSPNMMLYNKLVESQEKLEKIAYFDSVTGLYSKAYLPIAFKEFTDSFRKFKLVYIDILQFQAIKTLYGEPTAEFIIKEMAERIKKIIPDNCEVFKLIKDDFLILANCDQTGPLNFMDNLIEKLEKPYIKDYTKINVSVKIGVSKYPDNGKDVDELLSYSILALLSAKSLKHKKWVVFSNELLSKYTRSNTIELQLDEAIKSKKFRTVYQPIIEVDSLAVYGFEALSRWNHDVYGNISPGEFIPLLERTYKIYLLDKLVLHNTLEVAKKIRNISSNDYFYSVNFSAISLSYEDFVDDILQMLKVSKVEGGFLAMEVTETQVVQDLTSIVDKIQTLRSNNVEFYVDDFGEGYSSVNYLAKLKFDAVKISSNLSSSLLTDNGDKSLFKNIVKLVQDLGYKIIVEGVEDEKTFTLCKKFGVDYVQGYYFSKELSTDELLDYMQKESMKT